MSIIWKFNKQWFNLLPTNGKRSLSSPCGTSLEKADVAITMCKVEEDNDGFSASVFSGLDTPTAQGTPTFSVAELF